jgi:hypothetical protein
MAPRGLKKILKSTCPAKLVKSGRFKCFETLQQGVPSGQKLKGLTKKLERRIYSDGSMPSIARYGNVKRKGWTGKNGGRRRGSAVDAQLTRAVNSGKIHPMTGQYTLTKITLAALAEHGLEPVACQRAVCSQKRRIGTAIDLLAYEKTTARLFVVELKCGHSGSKEAAAEKHSKPCKMNGPLSKAPDNFLNRHLAQLACTREMFAQETLTLSKLNSIGISSEVGGALLYVNEERADLYTLSTWWTERSVRILDYM